MIHSFRTRNTLACAAICVSLWLPAAATADVVTLAPAKDNTLIETPVGNSNGAGDGIYAGRVSFLGGGTRRRAVVAFDLSSIPSNATIDSVRLTLAMVGTSNPAEQTLTLHRLSADWGEAGSTGGGQGGPAQVGEATWAYRSFNTIAWGTPGGDFTAPPSASQAVADLGTYVWSGAGLASDAQAWVAAPSSNHGWVLLGNEASDGTVKKFGSRENLISPPQLRVVWSPSNAGVGSGPRAGKVWFAPPTPSPASGPVHLSYTLPRAARVSLSVHDAAGRLVRRLSPAMEASTGRHDVTWDGRGEGGQRAASGVYLATLIVDGQSFVRRVPLMK